jgi:prepilin signal peptidase PulO-like enzyme (type II secretory pathway)
VTAAASSVPTWWWALCAGLLGLAIGSFWTVVVWRWPRGESVVAPRSHCTGCDRTLHAHELVPVGSWLWQRGQCRGCGSRIHWRYPAIEAATGLLAAGAILLFGPTLTGIAAALLAMVLVPVVVIDLEHQLIPDVIVLPAAAVGLALGIAAHPDRWWVPIVAALGAGGFMFALWLAYPGGMGLGDAKFALLLGAVLGLSVIPALGIAFAVGALLGIVMIARHGAQARKTAVPFGPFLAAGALVALVWGPTIVDWYTSKLA